MATDRRLKAFGQGQGIEGTSYCCSECGYESENRKNFRNGAEDGTKTCSTGHYEKDGELKRARNAYAKVR